MGVAVRFNATDGVPYPYGFGAPADGSRRRSISTEPMRLARMLADAGCTLLNVTAGIPAHGPHINRPFDRPVDGHARRRPSIRSSGVSRLLGLAAAIQAEVPAVPVVGDRPLVAAAVLAARWRRACCTPAARGSRASGGACSPTPTPPPT